VWQLPAMPGRLKMYLPLVELICEDGLPADEGDGGGDTSSASCRDAVLFTFTGIGGCESTPSGSRTTPCSIVNPSSKHWRPGVGEGIEVLALGALRRPRRRVVGSREKLAGERVSAIVRVRITDLAEIAPLFFSWPPQRPRAGFFSFRWLQS